MKKVYICSPYKGSCEKSIAQNRQRALMYCRFAYEQGCNPFAPHAIYPEFMDDEDKRERADGMRMGQEWMWAMQEMWVFGNKISAGMKEEIKLAELMEMKIRYFDEGMEEIT
jgi:hypothetical protein